MRPRIALAALLACASQAAHSVPLGVRLLSPDAVHGSGIALTGTLVTAYAVTDNDGDHLLVLTRLGGPSHSQPRSERKERTDLNASYFLRAGEKWAPQWSIRDFVDCPGLDHEAVFFPDHVTITDLNANGKAEVTVAYKLFCGGGVDASTLKVILREGEHKFAMRGMTLVQTPGSPPFGGEATYDKSLDLPANRLLRKHIASVRAQIVLEKY